MSQNHREGVNPLRPYYIPPSIGDEPIAPSSSSSAAALGSHALGSASRRHAATGGTYASKARDMFSDIDYKDYLSDSSPSALRTLKELLDELLWKYTSVLMAQPFEVAKTLLQVRSQDDVGGLGPSTTTPVEDARQRQPSRRAAASLYDDDSESDPDEPAYFTSNLPSTPTPTATTHNARSEKPRPASPLRSPRRPPAPPPHQLALRRPDSVLEALSQLWGKEGAWGVWKGTNAAFVYTALQSLLENWSRSLLSALFNVPDLGVRDDLDRLIDIASPYPWASLTVAAAAAVVTGVILAPLDLVRTRLIVTPTAHAYRRSFSLLRHLPSYLCPPSLLLPTALHSLVHPLLTLSTPLVLRTRFAIDRDLSPTTFSVAKFCTSSLALFVKLPLETVLRRGQVAVLSSPSYLQAAPARDHSSAPRTAAGGRRLGSSSAAQPQQQPQQPQSLETVVVPGRFDGVLGTMRIIVAEEGSRPVKPRLAAAASSSGGGRSASGAGSRGKTRVVETVYRRGQGLEGLWRGWKVSWWGIVGLWTAGVLGGGGDGEF